VHMPAKLFQHVLESLEDGIQGGLTSGEVGARESFKDGGVAVFFTPEISHLPQPSLNSWPLALSVLISQLISQFRARG
jgi:hypothetical protein